MPSKQTLDRFIAKVETNKHDEAIAILARAKTVTSNCISPVFQSGDLVVIRWKFRFVWKDDSVMEMEELAYQRWEGEKIAEEQFFYDPAQREPR